MSSRAKFRCVERGDVTLELNSLSQTSTRFVDRTRLRTNYTEEYVPSATDGKPGKWEKKTVTASIEDNVRQSADGMGHRSSFKGDGETESRYGGCCAPSFYDDSGPLTKRRGDSK